MFDKIKKWLSEEPEPPPPPKPELKAKKPKAPKVKPELTDKEKTTAAGEPYIAITRMSVDPNNVNAGEFEFDWNDKFIINLIKAGYKIRNDDTDSQIVDRWFQTVCRNVALEVYEQEQADPDKRESDIRVIQQRDLGGGYTEVS
jgi:hypothetical protein